jgi:hypothetical protein
MTMTKTTTRTTTGMMETTSVSWGP